MMGLGLVFLRDKLTFRLCWQIEIEFVYLTIMEEDEVGMYSAYVDAITGEVVYIRPNFQEEVYDYV